MSAQPANPKEDIRRQLRTEAALHSLEERTDGSTRIVEQILRQQRWSQSAVILFFWPTASEPDLRILSEQALRERKTVAFPKYLASEGVYRAFCVTNLEHEFTPGRFGIAEPGSACAECSLNKLDLIFVPGLGFTPDGARLGRGKGYYDRLLAEISAHKCGVAFDWQILAELPSEAHDVRVDCLVTPSGWREVACRREK